MSKRNYLLGGDPNCEHVWVHTGMFKPTNPAWDVYRCVNCGAELNVQQDPPIIKTFTTEELLGVYGRRDEDSSS